MNGTEQEEKKSTRKGGWSPYGNDLLSIKATPDTIIVRCVSIEKRAKMDQVLQAMKLDLKNTPKQLVYSDEEWEEKSEHGKKTYIICSMGNFRIFGGNGWWYSSGPMHRDEYIYNDKDNMRNAMIVVDHELTFIPDVEALEKREQELQTTEKKAKHETQEEEFLYHPAKLKAGAKKPQAPVYNPNTHKYELICSVCGNAYDEMDVSYTYSAEKGYVYTCKNCNPSKVPFKRLSYLEKLAKMSHTDLDNYSFDGSD